MSDYSLQLVSESNQGKKRTTTISHVNPTATPATLVEFSQRLNLLTLNTYGQTDLVVKTNLDTETPPAPPVDDRETPTIMLNATPSAATINSTNGQQLTATYTGDGVWYCYIKGANFYSLDLLTSAATTKVITLKRNASDVPVGAVIGFIAEGTDTYKPITVEFEVQA